MAWTEEKIKQLKKLWAKGKSTVEIGRELGISKNAVVGKVHRLGLDSRPSPIKTPKNENKQTKRVTIQKEKDIVTLLDLKLNSCRWPYGDPFSEDFHFCGKECKTGKPYCPEHCKAAYTSLKELALENAREKKERMEMVMSPNGVPVLVRESEIPEEEVVETEDKKTSVSPEETEKDESEIQTKKTKSKKTDTKPEKPMPKQMIQKKVTKGIPVKKNKAKGK